MIKNDKFICNTLVISAICLRLRGVQINTLY